MPPAFYCRCSECHATLGLAQPLPAGRRPGPRASGGTNPLLLIAAGAGGALVLVAVILLVVLLNSGGTPEESVAQGQTVLGTPKVGDGKKGNTSGKQGEGIGRPKEE